MRLALMQPCFAPYAGYFRLLVAADVFVFHDDTQYVKQSWLNRNRLTRHDGTQGWLTIPVADAPTGTRIRDVRLAPDADRLWRKQYRQFKALVRDGSYLGEHDLAGQTHLAPPTVASVEIGARKLGLPKDDHPCTSGFADELNPDAKGQERVLDICKYFFATEYVNASGGINLYDPDLFARHGVKLKILKPYQGNMVSIIERLALEDPREVRKEIEANVQYYD